MTTSEVSRYVLAQALWLAKEYGQGIRPREVTRILFTYQEGGNWPSGTPINEAFYITISHTDGTHVCIDPTRDCYFDLDMVRMVTEGLALLDATEGTT
jgi:hypothetical protein